MNVYVNIYVNIYIYSPHATLLYSFTLSPLLPDLIKSLVFVVIGLGFTRHNFVSSESAQRVARDILYVMYITHCGFLRLPLQYFVLCLLHILSLSLCAPSYLLLCSESNYLSLCSHSCDPIVIFSSVWVCSEFFFLTVFSPLGRFYRTFLLFEVYC